MKQTSIDLYGISLPQNELVSLLTTIVVVLYLTSIFFAKKQSRLRGPSGYPLIGNALDASAGKLLESLATWRIVYGRVFEFSAIGTRVVVLSDPTLAKEVLSKRPKTFVRVSNGKSTAYLSDLMGFRGGLFHSEGVEWSRARRITAPSFSRQNINNKLGKVFIAAVSMVRRYELLADGATVVDIKHESFMYTLRVLVYAALGLNLEAEEECYFFGTDEKGFASDLLALLRFQLNRVLVPLPNWAWRLSPLYKYQVVGLAANRRMESWCSAIIRRCRAAVAKETAGINAIAGAGASCMIEEIIRKNEQAASSHRGQPKPGSIAASSVAGDIRAEADDSMNSSNAHEISEAGASDSEVLANVKTFFIAGSETTSITVTWMCFFLSRPANARVLQALRAEAEEFFQKIQMDRSQAEIEPEGLPEVAPELLAELLSSARTPLAHAVFKETVRLRPPASSITHEPTDAVPAEGLLLARGVGGAQQVRVGPRDRVMVYLDGLLCDTAAYGADASSFNPTRWLTTDAARLARMQDNFLAFGHAARVCPGMGLAQHEGVMALLFLVHHFDFELACPEAEIHTVFALTTIANKMPMRLSVRHDVLHGLMPSWLSKQGRQ